MRGWITRGVVGILLATFFSDVGHEMATAVLPLYLGSIGLGAAALGAIEGVADLLFSLSKLGGGFVGHHTERKLPWVTAGYLATSLGTAAMALVRAPAALASLRAVAWLGRGFRSPLRDFLLADEVGAEKFGRAYGLERSADMLGAVAGPLVAVAMVGLGCSFQTVIAASLIPSLISVASIAALTRDRTPPPAPAAAGGAPRPSLRLPARFWWLLGGVFLFGLGDFSRTFLVLLAARAFGDGSAAGGDAWLGGGALLTISVLVYAGHNAVSAIAAYPIGRLSDRRPRLSVLVAGYALGVVTNLLLCAGSASPALLLGAVVLSGIYIAVEETVEKATAAELLPREQRAFGLGVLAAANALGDMVSSVGLGLLLDAGREQLAFALAAAAGAAGTAWILLLRRRMQ